jgi:hypothetical protein
MLEEPPVSVVSLSGALQAMVNEPKSRPSASVSRQDNQKRPLDYESVQSSLAERSSSSMSGVKVQTGKSTPRARPAREYPKRNGPSFGFLVCNLRYTRQNPL